MNTQCAAPIQPDKHGSRQKSKGVGVYVYLLTLQLVSVLFNDEQSEDSFAKQAQDNHLGLATENQY